MTTAGAQRRTQRFGAAATAIAIAAGLLSWSLVTRAHATPGIQREAVATVNVGTARRGEGRLALPQVPPRPPLRPLGELPAAAVAAVVRAAGHLTTSEYQALQVADLRFRQLDASGSGALSLNEIIALYVPPAQLSHGAGVPFRTAFANQYLALFDRDRDHALTSHDLPQTWAIIEALDMNRDERLNRDELESLPDLFAKRAFDHADTNQDRSLHFTEFALWWRTLPSLRIR